MNEEIKEVQQDNLFGEEYDLEGWKEEWRGMPEFIQEDAEPIQQIIVSFICLEDVNTFSKLINQNITEKTKSLWFPEMELEAPSNFVYTDES